MTVENAAADDLQDVWFTGVLGNEAKVHKEAPRLR